MLLKNNFMIYSFRFKVVENVTAAASNIASAFGGMRIQVGKFATQVNTLPRSIDKVEQELSQLRDAQRSSFDAREIKRYGSEIRAREQELEKLNRMGGQAGGGMLAMGRVAGSVAGPVAAVFAADKVFEFGRSVVDTLGKFQRFEAVLTNALGSKSAAKTVLADITAFAAKTPFQVDELTDSYVKLANRGFKPTIDQMTVLGDLASSQGKGFDQLSEAILDAETAEFERLKEFGIRASKEGDRVTLAFKGIQKQVENSPEAIRAALLALAKEAPGVAGAMGAISKTTEGMLSNLSDQFTSFKLQVGLAFAPIIAEWLPKITIGLTQLSGWVSRNQDEIRVWTERIVKVGVVLAGLSALASVFRTFQAISSGVSGLAKAFSWVFSVGLKLVPVIKVISVAIAGISTPVWIVVGVVAAAAALIVSYWDEIKVGVASVGEWLAAHNPFAWIADLVDRVFPGFKSALAGMWQGVKDVFSNALKWVWDKFIQPITGWFKGLFKGLGLGWSGEAAAKPSAELEPITPSTSSATTQSNKTTTVSKSPLGVSDAMSSVGGANGGSPRHVTINIRALVERMEFHTTNMGENTRKIKEEVTRVLLDAVNDVNYAT